jgi:ribonuclease J
VATIIVNRAGVLAAPPQVSLIGLVEAQDSDDMQAKLRDAASAAVESLPKAMRRDDAQIKEVANRALRKAVNERIGKRALIDVQLVRL